MQRLSAQSSYMFRATNLLQARVLSNARPSLPVNSVMAKSALCGGCEAGTSTLLQLVIRAVQTIKHDQDAAAVYSTGVTYYAVCKERAMVKNSDWENGL